ncbi:MAG TPA: TIM barrel protein [Vicinamibacterales bacterium]|nr:TIM barrel protein [Vicinamibacterales bacterium]
MTRREFGAIALGAFALPQIVNGVRLGAQSYSFRDLPRTPGGDAVDQVIRAFKECELTECELFAPQVEPQFSTGARGRRGDPPSPEAVTARDDLRQWRLETPLDHFTRIGDKFKAAGIEIYAYNYSPDMSFTDAEIDRGFDMAKAMGAQIITASTQLDTAKRIAPFAERHRMIVAMHGHSNTSDANEFATPESFAAAMKLSKYFKVNLDIGHFTAANYDAVAYIKAHHADITNLHLKDRRKNQGDNVPWGQGDTPIREALQLLQREQWPIRAYVEYEYRGQGTSIEEVKKCLAYAQAALA